MREILFRGKSNEWKTYNNWWQGYLVGDYEGNKYFCYYEKEKTVFVELQPETIGQYTGLKDKNGNKIFEGDILAYQKDDNSNNYIVKWKESGSQFVAMNDINFTPTWVWEKLEIIGNIHDNKEN